MPGFQLIRILFLLNLLAALACATGVTLTPKVGTVHERKLVKESPTYKGILNQNKKYCPDQAAIKTFENPTLAYVTPWYH
jgi:hypothetical protein